MSDLAGEVAALRAANARLQREIATLKLREAQAQRLADRDGLTGLYNRRRMSEMLDAALFEAARQRHALGLLFIDLDGFKHINDTHGHAVGDRLLTSVASRIASRARAADAVCRYGGDEFVVLLPQVRDRSAALKVANAIVTRVALPYRIDGEEMRVTAAVGVSMFPDDGESAADLLARADERMYRAKSVAPSVRGGVVFPAAPSRRRDDKSKRRPAVTELSSRQRYSRHG